LIGKRLGDRGAPGGRRFRGGLVFKAHRLCASLNSRLESNEEREDLGAYGLMALGERDAELAPVPAPCVERVL